MDSYKEFRFINEYKDAIGLKGYRLNEGFLDSVKNLYNKISNMIGSVDENDELFKEYKKMSTDNIIKMINKVPVPVNKALKQFKDMREVIFKNKDKVKVKVNKEGDSFDFKYEGDLNDAVAVIDEYIKATIGAVPDRKLQTFTDQVIKTLRSVNKRIIATKLMSSLSDEDKKKLKQTMPKEAKSKKYQETFKELENDIKAVQQEKDKQMRDVENKLMKTVPTPPQDLFTKTDPDSDTDDPVYDFQLKKVGKDDVKLEDRVENLLKDCKMNGSGIEKKFDLDDNGYNELIAAMKMYYDFQKSVSGAVNNDILKSYNDDEHAQFNNKLAFAFFCTMCKSKNGAINNEFGLNQDVIDTYFNASGTDAVPAFMQLYGPIESNVINSLTDLTKTKKKYKYLPMLQELRDNIQNFIKKQQAIDKQRKAKNKDNVS